MFESSQTLYQGLLQSTTPRATGAGPVHVCTGTPVARGEERIGSTIPMPTFAGRLSTMNPFFLVGIPQNSMAGQQRQQISELQFDKIPTPSTFSCCKIRVKNQVTTCSDFPSVDMLWIKWRWSIPLQEEGQSRGTESPERGHMSSALCGRCTCLHPRRLPGN